MAEETPAPQRRPTAEDMPAVMDLVANGGEKTFGLSLRATCRQLGLHCPSTHTFIHADDGLTLQYQAAKDQRAEGFQEEALEVTKAAALGTMYEGSTVDPAGARAYLNAIQWAAARMSPKTAPVEQHAHKHEFGSMTDADLDERIAAKEAALTASASAGDGAEP